MIQVITQITSALIIPDKKTTTNKTICKAAPKILEIFAHFANPIGDITGKPNTIDGKEHQTVGANKRKYFPAKMNSSPNNILQIGSANIITNISEYFSAYLNN